MIKILLALQHFGEHKLPNQDSFRVEWDGHTAEGYYSLLGEGYEETQSQEWYIKLFEAFSEKMKKKGFEVDPSEEDLFECITYVTQTFDTEAEAIYWLNGFYERAQLIVIGASGDDDYSDYAPDYAHAFIQASKQIDKGELAKTFLNWMKEEESEFFDDNDFSHALKLLDPPTRESFIEDLKNFVVTHPYLMGKDFEAIVQSEPEPGEQKVEFEWVVQDDKDGKVTGILITTYTQ